MKPSPDLLCLGSAHWDAIGQAQRLLERGADAPGTITRRPGGVALNIAVAAATVGLSTALLSAVGRDADGDDLLARCAELGVECRYVHRSSLPSGHYLAIEDAGGLVAAVADARCLETAGEAVFAALGDGRLGTEARPWAGSIAIDSNLAPEVFTAIAGSPLFAAADLRVVPASPDKAERVRVLMSRPRTTLYLNLREAQVLCGRAVADAPEAAAALLARGAHRVLVTDGPRLAADGSAAGIVVASPPGVTVQRVTGAGDTLMAAHLVAERAGADRASALQAGLNAAAAFISEGEKT